MLANDMEEELDYRNLLEKNRVEVIKCLNLDRQFLFSYLRSHSVLDDEDCEIILNAGASRQQKCSKFLDVLSTRGPRAIEYFIQALEIDHEYLYEVITGKKPLNQPLSSNYVVPLKPVLSEKELHEHKREYLLNELTKLAEENRNHAYLYSKTLTEKNVLEKRLNDLKEELIEKEKIINSLEEDIKLKSLNNCSKLYSHHFREMLIENADKSNVIIGLQARLLLLKERNEIISYNNVELVKKNEDLMNQIKDLAIKYDFKRLESKRLSLQINLNCDSLKAASDCKKEIYSLKFKLIQANEEKNYAEKKFEEAQKVISDMKLQLELLQNKSYKSEKKEVSLSHLELEEEISNMKLIHEKQKKKIEGLERKISRLDQEIETHKEEKAFYLTERQQAICDRNRIEEERNELQKHNKVLQDLKEETVQKQIKISSHYEKKNKELSSELDKKKEELALKINEINLLKNINQAKDDEDTEAKANLKNENLHKSIQCLPANTNKNEVNKSNEQVLRQNSEFESVNISESEKNENTENNENNENNVVNTSIATSHNPNQQIFEYDGSHVYKMFKEQKSAAAALLMAVPLFGAATLFSGKEPNNHVTEENNSQQKTNFDKTKQNFSQTL
ncbi:caspase recruitment domain-containing protein 11 isoform X1 [Hydra vulgaris]|uniref:caspase recruitment domain-containing protein 11 isoform X1 n=1 Tax=Hydra vulgaris TaxID=6087 RepID=UPI00064158EB|nr:caspase recruitment domain-containing protein 11 [Hydra vulgaris]